MVLIFIKLWNNALYNRWDTGSPWIWILHCDLLFLGYYLGICRQNIVPGFGVVPRELYKADESQLLCCMHHCSICGKVQMVVLIQWWSKPKIFGDDRWKHRPYGFLNMQSFALMLTHIYMSAEVLDGLTVILSVRISDWEFLIASDKYFILPFLGKELKWCNFTSTLLCIKIYLPSILNHVLLSMQLHKSYKNACKVISRMHYIVQYPWNF